MSFTVQHIRSDQVERRPDPADLVEGQLAVNYSNTTPGVYFKTDTGNLIKAGPMIISDLEPEPRNYTPFLVGEMWLDTSKDAPALKVWDGREWLLASQAISDINGSLIPSEDCTHSLGAPDRRWCQVYTCDIDMCNEGSKNDVDGTWGSYLIQEGEEDLFLINRRSGKKYKFMISEV